MDAMNRFALVLLLALSGCSGGTPSATVQSVRIGPFANPSGQTFQMVFVDWKNTGNAPVAVVNADLIGYSASGQVVWQVADQTVFASSKTVAPGESYSEPSGEGYLVLPEGLGSVPVLTRVEAKVTKVKSELRIQ